MRTEMPRLIEYLTGINMVVAAGALVVMLGHVVVDVVLRELFHVPMSGTLEIVSYWYMVALVFLAIPAAQARGEHIQVELFTASVSPRTRTVIDIFVLIFSAALLVLFTWVTIGEALRQTGAGTVVEAGTGTIPVWPTRWLVPFSMGSTCLICIAQAISLTMRLMNGETFANQPSDGAHV